MSGFREIDLRVTFLAAVIKVALISPVLMSTTMTSLLF